MLVEAEDALEEVRNRKDAATEQIEEEDLLRIIDETLEHRERYFENLEDVSTVKHGTSLDNYDEIIEEGLIPGDNNDSVTGESSESDGVSLSPRFTVALRYAQISDPTPDQLIDKAESSLPEVHSNKDLSNKKDRDAVKSGLSRLSQAYSMLERIDDLEQANYENRGPMVVEVPLDETDIELEQGLTGNELEESSLGEIRTGLLEPSEDWNVFVPIEHYDQIDKDFKPFIGLLEARALAHEANMKEDYLQDGKLVYNKPALQDDLINSFDFEEEVGYSENPFNIDVSSVYRNCFYPKEN